MVLGVDIGYGYTKCFFKKDNGMSSYTFRTAVSKFIPKTTFGDKMAVYKVNGEEFTVGDDAIREGKLINTRREGFVGSNPYYAILGYAIQKTNSYPKVLVLGLPPGQYTKENVEELIKSLKSIKILDNNESLLTIPSTVKYIPQGAGIFFFHVIKNNSSDYNRRVVVMDIGYYTVDMLLFNKGKYVEGAARSFPFGVYEIYENIKKRFTQEHKVYLKNDESVDTLIKNSIIEIAGIHYKLDCLDSYEFYNSRINSILEEYIEELPTETDIVLVGGGGVKFLNNNSKYKMTFVSSPQLANAIGYFEYGKHYT